MVFCFAQADKSLRNYAKKQYGVAQTENQKGGKKWFKAKTNKRQKKSWKKQ